MALFFYKQSAFIIIFDIDNQRYYLLGHEYLILYSDMNISKVRLNSPHLFVSFLVPKLGLVSSFRSYFFLILYLFILFDNDLARSGIVSVLIAY